MCPSGTFCSSDRPPLTRLIFLFLDSFDSRVWKGFKRDWFNQRAFNKLPASIADIAHEAAVQCIQWKASCLVAEAGSGTRERRCFEGVTSKRCSGCAQVHWALSRCCMEASRGVLCGADLPTIQMWEVSLRHSCARAAGRLYAICAKTLHRLHQVRRGHNPSA